MLGILHVLLLVLPVMRTVQLMLLMMGIIPCLMNDRAQLLIKMMLVQFVLLEMSLEMDCRECLDCWVVIVVLSECSWE